jgi:hypothetical protein
VLANRLKSVLPNIISENQSAFVPGRIITDNALVAFEVMHYLQQKRTGKDTYMAFKLDMSKAYDRVEWVFIEHIMRQLGFEDQWISLIMKCISTIQYSMRSHAEQLFHPEDFIKETPYHHTSSSFV